MPIKLNVPFADKNHVKSLGAWWFNEEKAWAIPDSINDINPFAKWLPQQEGFIVKWPHVLLKGKRLCWKCREETPLIGLGAKTVHANYPENDAPWSGADRCDLLFMEIDYLDIDFSAILQAIYPFFRLTFSKSIGEKYWANTCIHCQSLQGDNYNFHESNGVFNFLYPEDAKRVERESLKLRFDYFISASHQWGPANEYILGLKR